MKKPTANVRAGSLQLTSDFEGFTGIPTGNFDNQIISWGPLQWNAGQNTLQPLLRNIRKIDPEAFEKIMGDDFSAAVDDNSTFKRFALDHILRPGYPTRVKEEWARRFVFLAETEAAKLAFQHGAKGYFERGQKLCEELGFLTERGYALCFDVAVQNGAPRQSHINAFRKRIEALKKPLSEWKQLKIFAQVVADAANPRWRHDVLARKLTIALGGGVVHGRHYDLDDYGLSYERLWYTGGLPCGIERVFLDGVELSVKRMSFVGNKLYVATKR